MSYVKEFKASCEESSFLIYLLFLIYCIFAAYFKRTQAQILKILRMFVGFWKNLKFNLIDW